MRKQARYIGVATAELRSTLKKTLIVERLLELYKFSNSTKVETHDY